MIFLWLLLTVCLRFMLYHCYAGDTCALFTCISLFQTVNIHLSHMTVINLLIMNGAPDTNRTCDPPLRRGMLYPLSYEGISTYVYFLTFQSV